MSFSIKGTQFDTPVIGKRDYRRLLSQIVRTYLSNGYILLENNTSIYGHPDHIEMTDGTTNVLVCSKSVRKNDVRDPSTMTLCVTEGGETVIERTFYLYKSQHDCGHGGTAIERMFHLYKSQPDCGHTDRVIYEPCVRYCESVKEWKSFCEIKRSRMATNRAVDERTVISFTDGIDRWDEIVKKVLPIVHSRKEYKGVVPKDICRVDFITENGSYALRGEYETTLKVRIAIEGKDAVELKNKYGVPSFYRDVHEEKSSEGRICIHGVHVPAYYAEKGIREYRNVSGVMSAWKLTDGKDRAGVLFLSAHPVYGTTYMVLNNDGKVVANGYVPLEANNVGVLTEIKKRASLYPYKTTLLTKKQEYWDLIIRAGVSGQSHNGDNDVPLFADLCVEC